MTDRSYSRMKCPVCGEDCIKNASEILALRHEIFKPCPDCSGRTFDKQVPLPDISIAPPCSCGKRFIDEVFAHVYAIRIEEGDLNRQDPLRAAGIPLIHPGFAMASAPYLPEKSLVLLSHTITRQTADRLMAEVPEMRGVVKCGDFVPGIEDIDLDGIPEVHTLLAGCDVRANIFTAQTEPIVVYKQQSTMHIEFPRGYDPKIIAVGANVRKFEPRTFVDALCGAGTLGILGALLGVPHVILNDAWYAAAFWAAYNVRVNGEQMKVDSVDLKYDYEEMKQRPVEREPRLIAETTGEQSIEVYQGDFRQLHTVLPADVDLSVIDIFEKRDRELTRRVADEWRSRVGGEVFIP